MNRSNEKSGCQPKLGKGIYTIPDTARILHLPKSRIRRWISGYCKFTVDRETCTISQPVIDQGTWAIQNSRALNFYALIELYTFTALRELGVPLQKIRRARTDLIKRFNVSYPFASYELLCDGKQILVKFRETASSILMYLGENGQTALKDIVEPFCKKIDFSSQTKLAEKYWPLGKSRFVVVDPNRGFGRPTIIGTNITTKAVAGLVNAGDPLEEVARLYKIKSEWVEDAVEFELGNAA
jgi:uncharacterized protein (DUF433 family)